MNHYEQISAALADQDLDAILLTSAANRFYASGFFIPEGDGVVLASRSGACFFTDARYTEAAGRVLTGAELLELTPERTLSAQLSEQIFLKGIRRLGFEENHMTVQAYRRYEKLFAEGKPSCELVPAGALMAGLRRSKDPEELASLEAAQRIAERALEDILQEIRPGVTEKEIAARLQYLMLHYGASDMSFDPIVVSGVNGSLPHGVPSEKQIQAGEFVTMDFGCIYQGYCSDMTRTVAVGYASSEMWHVYQTVLEAQAAGIAAARAGVTGKAVDAAARDVIAAAGFGAYFTHSFGHGVGVEIHEAPNASSRNEEPLPAGAVISAEPGIYIPGKLGVRIEDVIVLTEDGCRNLTKAPKELLIL
ncbi:MAG: aminopeptidase P family protein [Oscillibacter sp.]|nr:aminopeptidase P family protein [Oscillibacter sp.]